MTPEELRPLVIVIDNYDSFTYNLVHAFHEGGARVVVHRNDAITRDALESQDPEAIVLSPGPGSPANPRDFGVCRDLIETPVRGVPMLGVCLGMQGMAHWTGGRVAPAPTVVHGEASRIALGASPLWVGLPEAIDVGRYHSLVVDGATLPDDWQVTATTQHGTVMAMDHKRLAWHGVQFHPESILTPDGQTIIGNFLESLP